MPKTFLSPTIINGGLSEDLGNALDVTIVPIPGRTKDRSDSGRRAIALDLYFTDAAGDPIHGRVGFSGGDDTITLVDGDDQLGYHKRDRQAAYAIPGWAKYVYLASDEADAIARGSWLYE